MADYKYLLEIQAKGLGVLGKITLGTNKIVAASKRASKGLSSIGDSMFKLNQAAEGIGRVSAALEDVVRPGLEFQQSMADLSAITGIAGKDLSELGKVARKTGIESGLGATQATEAFKLLASQISVDKIGIDGLKLLQKETITLAHASGLGMQDAANAMAGTINQFGLEAKEASRIINVLAAGSKYGAAEIPELAQSFKVVGASASAAGINVEQTAGALEVLSLANLKGAEAGTALRNILLQMQTKMNVDFKVTKMSDALKAMAPHLEDTTMLAKTFGMENIAAAQFLIKNASAVDDMTTKLTGTNVAQEQANIRMNTAAERIKIMQARFADWGISAANATKDYLPLISGLSQGSMLFMNLSPLLLGMSKALGFVGKNAKRAALGMWSFAKKTALAGWNALKAMGKFVLMAVGGLGSLISGLVSATLSQIALNVAMSANPIGLIVLGIAALIAAITALVMNWDKVKVAMGKFWTWLKSFFSNLGTFILKYNPLSLMINVMDKLFPGFKNWISKAIDEILKWFTQLWDKVVKAFEKVKTFFGFGKESNIKVDVDNKPKKASTGPAVPIPNLSQGLNNTPVVDPAGNQEIQDGMSSINNGGSKSTNINITIGKFQDSIKVYANNLDESLEEIEDKIVSRLVQVVNRANQLQGV